MLARLLIISFLTLTGLAQARGGDEILKFEIPISPDIAQYIFLLETPSYAALALQNSGLTLSLSKPLHILSRTTFEVGPGKIKYVNKKEGVFKYDVFLTLPLGKQVVFSLEVDSDRLALGLLKIHLDLPLAGLIPREWIEKVESKLLALSNANAQKQLIDYLAKIDVKQNNKISQIDTLDRIAFDAYVQAGLSSMEDAGSSESVSDQTMLIASIIIWLVCFPAFLIVVRRKRIRPTNAAQTIDGRTK